MGFACIVIGNVGSDIQPFEAWVKVNEADPPVMPVTTPPVVTEATALLELTHVPPDTGVSWVVLSEQTTDGPMIETVGLLNTVIGADADDTQPVEVLVKTKLTLPAWMPDTNPPLVMEAMDGSLLIQVPPDTGERVVVLPAQTTALPEIAVDGIGLITT